MNLKRSGGVVIMLNTAKKTVKIIITKKKIKTVLATEDKKLTKLKDLINSKSKSNTGGSGGSLVDLINSFKKLSKEDIDDKARKFVSNLKNNDITELSALNLIMLTLILQLILQCVSLNKKVLTLTGSSYAEALVDGLSSYYSLRTIENLRTALTIKKREVAAKLKSLKIIQTLTIKEKLKSKLTNTSDLINSFCKKYNKPESCTKQNARSALDELTKLQLQLRDKSDLKDCETLIKNLTELLSIQACTSTISNKNMQSVLNNFKESDWVKKHEEKLLEQFCNNYNGYCYGKAGYAMKKLDELQTHLNSKQNLSDCKNLYNCLNRIYNWLDLQSVEIKHSGLIAVLNRFKLAYKKKR